MAKSKKRKMEDGLYMILNEWKKEEPENYEMNNRIEKIENSTMGLLTFLIRTNRIKGVEV